MERQDAPQIYFGNPQNPGVYIAWEPTTNSNNVALYEVQRADNFHGVFMSIADVAFPTTEYVDETGDPKNYYRIVELDSGNNVLSTSQPFTGEELLIRPDVAYEIKDLLRIPIIEETLIFKEDRTQARSVFYDWSYYPRPEIRISYDTQSGTRAPMYTLSEQTPIYRTYGNTDNYPNGLVYKLDYAGRVYFVDVTGNPVAIDQLDFIRATYGVKMFTTNEINAKMNMVLQRVNGLPGSNKYRSISETPPAYNAAYITGTSYYLLRALMVGLSQRQKRLLVDDSDYRFIDNLKATADMYKEEYEKILEKLPIMEYPHSLTMTTPENYMPGGRSRFFRYVWKGAGV